MQDFSLAFRRVSHATMAMNAEHKSRIQDLLSRAYFNIHGQNLASAEPTWVNSIVAAAMQLSLNAHVTQLTPRDTVHLFEHMIRISEEHLREARRHAAMASNVFYLKETALDAIAMDEHEATFHAVATTILGGTNTAHSGRVDVPKLDEPIA
jgi:hypothetical protein